MIKFKCSKCNENMEAPESMKGELLQCPNCRFPERVPAPEEGPEPLQIEEETKESYTSGDMVSTQIRTFETDSKLVAGQYEFKRPLIKSDKGATRVRTFHTRLAANAMSYMDDQINRWIDQNPDIEVKFTNATVGVVEGKKSEPHLIVTVWY